MKNLLKIAVAVMICILLVGCGNNVSGNVVASQKPIKIGYIGPLTGDAASLAVSSVRSIMMVEKEINSQGGINGRELQVIYEDGKCNGKDASLAAQKLININKVGFLIVGCSPEVLSIAPITEAAKVVMISPMATNPKIKEAGDYTFRVVPSDAGQGKIGAKLMLAADLSNVAVIYPNMDWGVGLKDVFVEEFEKSGKVVAAETFEMETKDVKTQLLKIKETKPDGIYMLAFAKQAGIILQQMNEIGLDIPVYAADASKDDTILEYAEELTSGLVVTAPGVPESEELFLFSKKYKSEYGEGWNAYGPETYDIIQIFQEACKSGSCKGEDIKNYLYAMNIYHGASGNFKFDSFGEVSKPYDKYVVRKGEFVKA